MQKNSKTSKNQKDSVPLYLFHQGNNAKAYQFFGSHFKDTGVVFRVWAPHAESVQVVGDFNEWNGKNYEMTRLDDGESFELFVPDLKEFSSYKYRIKSNGGVFDKADPYAFHAETRPATASKVYELEGYEWGDIAWEQKRNSLDPYCSPMNIYEVHLGSWKNHEDGSPYSYNDLAKTLVPYVKKMGYTHVEMLPITEYPLDMSWGYQCTGYFAATSRYGTPKELMHLVDNFHKNGIGVILDWVPGHFPKDAHGLSCFDGKPLYEYADSQKGEHKEWGTKIFDYEKKEVQSFLISSATFWLEKFHFDGLRVDAVASMLYLNYCRPDGQWKPNKFGGAENLEAVEFIKQLNISIAREFSGHRLMIAEESTSWPKVSKGTEEGGLGFNFKWNMGWMNDCLKYFSLDGLSRKFNHDLMTFSMFYAFAENFILPISHDEVVHGKLSLINRMPGDYDEKFAGARAFFGYMMAHPGKKLNMMGNEFGQFIEWKYDTGLDWLLLDYPRHVELQRFVRTLNRIYLKNPAFWQEDYSWNGFEWLVVDDNENSVLAFSRKDRSGDEIICVLNLTPVFRSKYSFGVSNEGTYRVILNSDEYRFGGKNGGTKSTAKTKKKPMHGKQNSITLNLPGFSCILLKRQRREDKEN